MIWHREDPTQNPRLRPSSRSRRRTRNFSSKNRSLRPKGPPLAPRNTTSFLMRANPCPVTPEVLPTPKLSPFCEGVVDMARERWGVDAYGSMKGLIRLRGSGLDRLSGFGSPDEWDSESDVEEVERRLDFGLSRFEMVGCPGSVGDGSDIVVVLLTNRVGDHDVHLTRLEEDNLALKDRFFMFESEIGDLRRRIVMLEADCYHDPEEEQNAYWADEALDLGEVCSEKSTRN